MRKESLGRWEAKKHVRPKPITRTIQGLFVIHLSTEERKKRLELLFGISVQNPGGIAVESCTFDNPDPPVAAKRKSRFFGGIKGA